MILFLKALQIFLSVLIQKLEIKLKLRTPETYNSWTFGNYFLKNVTQAWTSFIDVAEAVHEEEILLIFLFPWSHFPLGLSAKIFLNNLNDLKASYQWHLSAHKNSLCHFFLPLEATAAAQEERTWHFLLFSLQYFFLQTLDGVFMKSSACSTWNPNRKMSNKMLVKPGVFQFLV